VAVELNPNKCAFGVPSRQLLGFLVSHHGIEASTKQIHVIIEMGPPRCVKDVQKMTGCMAALNRFISRLGEKGLPFFKLLKKVGKFEWTDETNDAFERLKAYLTSSPILTPPTKREDMLLCIAVMTTVVSAAIIIKREEEGHVFKVQRLVYYVSEVLSDFKVRFLHVQKLLYAILITSHKLRHYFDEHKITVVTISHSVTFYTTVMLQDVYPNGQSSLGAPNIESTLHKAIKS
jgi:hypothetical protein